LILKGDTALVRVGTEQFVERLQSYVDLAPALRERIAAIDSVDLRFDQRVYVRPGEERELMARRERYLVGLDVGTSRVTAVVGESMDDGTLDVVGIGTAESRGIKRGVVVNVDAAGRFHQEDD
jgi:hypothetical protein